MLQVAIIGAGVNGICCAIKILEYYKSNNAPIQVTVIAEDFSPNTTGDGSAGLWGPFLLNGTNVAKIYKWSKDTHDFLKQLWLSEDAAEAGICLLPCVRLTTEANAKVGEFWRDIVYGATYLTTAQLAAYNVGRKKLFTNGLSFVTYTAEPVKLLPYLMKRFIKGGGRIMRKHITELDEFLRTTSYNVIVNCTGLGSRTLLNDQQTYAIRGQVTRVKANWLYHAILDESDDGNYIIPNVESVILGGTHQERDYNRNVCAMDKKFIVQGCYSLVPGLKHGQELFDWVGLRPGRTQVRLEALRIDNKLLIHNYGHGGSGVTLCWGCANDVLDILKNELQTNNKAKL